MKTKLHSQSGFLHSCASRILLYCVAASSIATATLLGFLRPEAPAGVSQRTLTFEERVAYQRAIEEVYWRHRLWPRNGGERPDPKPSVDAVMRKGNTSFVTRGFVRFANGNFSAPIVDPNDTGNLTEGRGINNSRLVCGEYFLSDGTFHGYFLMGGNFREFDVPDSVSTEVVGVNNIGDFCGDFTDATGLTQGFVSLGGTITPFSVPGATLTQASQLNSSNQTEGTYIDASGIYHGFWRGSNGALHFPIDPPGSTQTILFANNDSNWVVGRYMTADRVTHGLFFVPPNRFFTFDYPGSTFTSLNGINRDGFISGRYRDASGIDHGIIARVRVGAAANEEGTEIVSPTLR
jgi:hypothetical protein